MSQLEPYDHQKIEPKWQAEWAKRGLYRTAPEPEATGRPKFYILDMFPYPSGEGLHVGHPKGYIGTDIVSRFKRMNGYNVLHPMGWDAFGLPAENYAIKHKVRPRAAVEKNIRRYKKQLGLLGFDYDWSREINTTDPAYYRWTQWVFLQLFEKGLAYQAYEPINWCPSCQTGLANEDVENGRCERCGTVVERRPIRQWLLKITDYAERLLADLNQLDWPEAIKESQRNWIGRGEGAEISFELLASSFQKNSGTPKLEALRIFTTRPDTIFGVTFLAVSAEFAKKNFGIDQNFPETEEKLGVDTGLQAINPANGEVVPIWVTNYVLDDVGTGAVMGVPAHDERDLEFAEKYNLPVSDAVLVDKEEAIKIAGGQKVVRYKLRDWVFSRQRYWGEPIPVIHCEKCGVAPVPEKDLPVRLPEVEHYAPTGTGESPLANITEWVNTKCPKCGGAGKREINTMPQWAGSSWYYLRYLDPENGYELVDGEYEKYWSPVDLYVGGTEHATRHLIYARFWHKFLHDLGVVNYPEPFRRLKNQGLIAGADGRKMSKRFGNVVNPDDIVATYGADTLRLHEMFLSPFGEGANWSTKSIIGPRRFLEKVWRLGEKLAASPPTGKVRPSAEGLTLPESQSKLETVLHRTIKKVAADIQDFKFNTAISALMVLAGVMEKVEEVSAADFEILLKLLAPFAPHLTEELWSRLGHTDSIHLSPWPAYREDKIQSATLLIAIQVNGVVRDTLEIGSELAGAEIEELAKNKDKIKKWLRDHPIKKVIHVPGRLVNFVLADS